MDKKKLVIFAVTVALLIFAAFTSPISTMTVQGTRALIVFCAFIVAILGGLVPGGVGSIIFTMIMAFYGIFPSVSASLKEISVSLMAFAMGTLAITSALRRTTIPERVAKFAARISKGNSKAIILFFMFAACLLSALMSNTATCATIGSMAYAICQVQKNSKHGATNFGRCMMIGIPLGAGIGGCGTIAGSINNATALELYEGVLGKTIGFTPWMLIMIPATLVGMVLAWLVLITIWKPETLSEDVTSSINTKDMPKMNAMDKKVLAIILFMLLGWISTTWISAYNTQFIAIAGLILFMFPGIDVFKFKEFGAECSWEAVLLSGGVMGVVAGLTKNGVSDWLGQVLFGNVSHLPVIVLAMLIVLAAFILHAFIPVGGPIVSILLLPAISLCQSCGLNPAIGVLLVLIGANTCTILPIDALPILTKGYGFYEYSDYPKAGIPVTVLFTVLLPLIIIPLALLFKI